jgi:hypothetical protein
MGPKKIKEVGRDGRVGFDGWIKRFFLGGKMAGSPTEYFLQKFNAPLILCGPWVIKGQTKNLPVQLGPSKTRLIRSFTLINLQ